MKSIILFSAILFLFSFVPAKEQQAEVKSCCGAVCQATCGCDCSEGCAVCAECKSCCE